MPTPILMPKLSDDMREGKILAWKKKEGDPVESGEVIAEVETEKANLEVEAYSAGRLAKIVAPVGTTVPVGQPIAIVVEEGEELTAIEAAPPTATKAPTAIEAAPPAAPSSGDGHDRVRASPLARRMARDAALDLARVQGSGPGGRVVKVDVEKALAAPPPAARAPEKSVPPPPMNEETVPMSGMRRAIARRMAEAKPGAPHFYLTVDIDMGRALALRAQLVEEMGEKISVNDLVLRAAALALVRRPEVNASFAGESVKRHGSVHLGFAVAVDDGLLTPVIRDAQSKSLLQIAREARALSERARARKLKPDEYQGGTFTISNLGMFGVREFSAIINPGEAAILAVGAVEKRPVVAGDELKIGQVMSATLSGDHRVIDGALGAQLLKEFRALLEQPLRLLA